MLSENHCVLEMASIVAAMASEGIFRLPPASPSTRRPRPSAPAPAHHHEDDRGHKRPRHHSQQVESSQWRQHAGERSKRPRAEGSADSHDNAYEGNSHYGEDEDAEVDAAMAHASFAHALGDHYTFLNVMREWDACKESSRGDGDADGELPQCDFIVYILFGSHSWLAYIGNKLQQGLGATKSF
jgi:hypothetical protein